ncbi:hypothetical protein LTR36_010044 [Oleoguttula mirabilis]|uniref:Uncharacterized protein n=1 Tax=Oleoguttula mirabilis TaxID=1507867 RepID=A0AAV9JSF3_9PEZI|nr:hypothetical protein LTR36_010044 [Oleoguttula mirabilis]
MGLMDVDIDQTLDDEYRADNVRRSGVCVIWNVTEDYGYWTVRVRIRELSHVLELTASAPSSAEKATIRRTDGAKCVACEPGVQTRLMRRPMKAEKSSYILFEAMHIRTQNEITIFKLDVDSSGKVLTPPDAAADSNGHHFPSPNQAYTLMKHVVTFEMQEMWRKEELRDVGTERALTWAHHDLSTRQPTAPQDAPPKPKKVALYQRKLVVEDAADSANRIEFSIIKICIAEGKRRKFDAKHDLGVEDRLLLRCRASVEHVRSPR